MRKLLRYMASQAVIPTVENKVCQYFNSMPTVPRQGLSRNVAVWLSQCVAKPSPSSLKNVHLYLNFFVLSQRSLLLTLSFHCITKIFFMHFFVLLTKVRILFSVVLFIRHVSAPYSKTDLIFLLKRRIFVALPITLDFHTFLKMGNAALALLILVFTSASVPPRVSTILPRYLNASTPSSVSPSRMIGLSQVAVSTAQGLCFLFVDFQPGLC